LQLETASRWRGSRACPPRLQRRRVRGRVESCFAARRAEIRQPRATPWAIEYKPCRLMTYRPEACGMLNRLDAGRGLGGDVVGHADDAGDLGDDPVGDLAELAERQLRGLARHGVG